MGLPESECVSMCVSWRTGCVVVAPDAPDPGDVLLCLSHLVEVQVCVLLVQQQDRVFTSCDSLTCDRSQCVTQCLVQLKLRALRA